MPPNFVRVSAPIAITACVFEGVQLPYDMAQNVECKHFARLLTGPVARNLIRTTFLNKGKTDRLGARPKGHDKVEASKVGILGAVLGWGFPTYTGGTMSLIDTVGVATFVAECDALADKYGERFCPSDWLRTRATGDMPLFAAA
ncbi:hypothetical protein [Actibacterium sp. D379-3]